jgi:hypothetical protein
MFPTIAWGVIAGLLIGWQWPEFRGPNGAGKAQASGLPLTWSGTGTNVRVGMNFNFCHPRLTGEAARADADPSATRAGWPFPFATTPVRRECYG